MSWYSLSTSTSSVGFTGRTVVVVVIRGRTVKPSPLNSRGYAAGAPTETMYGVIYAP